MHDGYATDFYGTWDGRDLHLVFNHIGIDAFKAPPAITEEEINRELPAAIERTRIYETLSNLRRIRPGKRIEGNLPPVETDALTAAGIADAIAGETWKVLDRLLGEGSLRWSESSTVYDDSHWYPNDPFPMARTSHADDSAIRHEHGFSFRGKDGRRHTGDEAFKKAVEDEAIRAAMEEMKERTAEERVSLLTTQSELVTASPDVVESAIQLREPTYRDRHGNRHVGDEAVRKAKQEDADYGAAVQTKKIEELRRQLPFLDEEAKRRNDDGWIENIGRRAGFDTAAAVLAVQRGLFEGLLDAAANDLIGLVTLLRDVACWLGYKGTGFEIFKLGYDSFEKLIDGLKKILGGFVDDPTGELKKLADILLAEFETISRLWKEGKHYESGKNTGKILWDVVSLLLLVYGTVKGVSGVVRKLSSRVQEIADNMKKRVKAAANPPLNPILARAKQQWGPQLKELEDLGKGHPKYNDPFYAQFDELERAARVVWDDMPAEYNKWLQRVERLVDKPVTGIPTELVSPKAIWHILVGDKPTKGGHLHPAAHKKDVFPQDCVSTP